MNEIFKVSKDTDPKKLARAVMSKIQFNDGVLLLRCLGAASVNQAVKALTILIGMGSTVGLNIYFRSHFEIKELNGEEKTFINFRVHKL